jgi:hypothetical protein
MYVLDRHVCILYEFMFYIYISVHRVTEHGRIARGGHGFPKVSLGPAMPYPSTLCRQATPETTLQPFQGWPAAIFYPLGHPTPYAYAIDSETPRRCKAAGQKPMVHIKLHMGAAAETSAWRLAMKGRYRIRGMILFTVNRVFPPLYTCSLWE